MINSNNFTKSILMTGLILTAQVHAKSKCPEAISGAVQTAYPESKISSCKQEKEDGKIQFVVSLASKTAGNVELDLDTTGSILLTEQIVPVDSVSKGAMSGFKSKYPGVKISRAEKQTKPDGSVTYELSFQDKNKKHDATFRQNGEFVELE